MAIHSKNNIGLLLDEDVQLPNRDMDKAEVFNAFFDCFFSMHDRSRESQCPELEDHDCENDQLPADLELVRDLQLDHSIALFTL